MVFEPHLQEGDPMRANDEQHLNDSNVTGHNDSDQDLRPRRRRGHEVWDHQGHRFSSVAEMCDYWRVSRRVFDARTRYGWTLERALTVPTGTRNTPCTDHTGRHFDSIGEMAEYWGIPRNVLSNRLNSKEWDLARALTTPVRHYAPKCPKNAVLPGQMSIFELLVEAPVL
jgi:hypothetical protein